MTPDVVDTLVSWNVAAEECRITINTANVSDETSVLTTTATLSFANSPPTTKVLTISITMKTCSDYLTVPDTSGSVFS